MMIWASPPLTSIKLFSPSIDERTKKEVLKVLDSGWWDQGKKVEEFERKLRDYLGCRHVIAVSSGTAALHLALSLFPQKKVMVPALSFVATALAGLYSGKKVMFSDVNTMDLTMEYFSLAKDTINLPVHFGGMPVNIDGDNIIEDCAHAMGSRLTTKNIKCFSFHVVKNLAMPNGGAIALYSDEHVDELKEKRWCGISDNGKRDVKRLGWNYKLNDINAVIGIEQLKRLDEDNRKRYKIAEEYHDKFDHGLELMPLIDGCSYHLFWVLVKNRDKFREKLRRDGIETNIHYQPIHKFSYFKDANLPVTEYVSKHIVSIPCHPNLSGNDLDRIIKSCNS